MRPNVEILRARVAGWLTDSGTVQWQDGMIRDPETGLDVPNWVTRYAGALLVQPQVNYRRVEAGGAVITVTKYDVTLPADTHVEPDDRIEVVTCAFDTLLAGTFLRVLGVSLDSWQLGRYCVAETLG